MNKNRLESLQVLRFIAALLVVLYHITLHYNNTEFSFLGNIFIFGKSGVDIFFVLSGFIILYSLSKKKQTPLEFITKRTIRIFTPYWLLLFLPTLVIQLLNISDKYPHLLEINPMLNTFFLTISHIQIGPSWTLTYEVVFYLLVFIGILFKMAQKTLLLFFVLPFISFFIDFSDIGNYIFFTTPIILEFLIGIIIFKIYTKNLISKPNSILLLIVASSIFIFNGLMLEFISDNYPSINQRVLLFGLPSGGIILALVSLEKFAPLKTPPFFILLGSSSYSLYLIHAYIVSPIDSFALNFSSNSYIINSISIFGVLLVTVLSIFIYKIIELPSVQFLNKWINKKVFNKT